MVSVTPERAPDHRLFLIDIFDTGNPPGTNKALKRPYSESVIVNWRIRWVSMKASYLKTPERHLQMQLILLSGDNRLYNPEAGGEPRLGR
jgi:hypothetical protein